jgi:3-hydroxyisobutyrate dehydrogenase-like beta-hydroxyacid dehydrogenase
MITIGSSGASGTGPEARPARPPVAVTIGVDHQALRDAVQGSPVNAPVALLKLAKIDAGDESPDLSRRWATKDVDLALAEAGTRHSRLPPPSTTGGMRW